MHLREGVVRRMMGAGGERVAVRRVEGVTGTGMERRSC